MNNTTKTSSRKPNRYTKAAFTVAHSALWNNRHFTEKEKAELIVLLSDHFESGKDLSTSLKEIIQRICLAKRYVSRRKGRYLPKPINWLNIHYPFGLSGTESWLYAVKEQRKTVPQYNKGISILANAITRFVESPDLFNFQRYRTLLIEDKQYDLIQIYNNTIINLLYHI